MLNNESVSYSEFKKRLENTLEEGDSTQIFIKPLGDNESRALHDNLLVAYGEKSVGIISEGEYIGTPLMLQNVVYNPNGNIINGNIDLKNQEPFNEDRYKGAMELFSKQFEKNELSYMDYPYDQYTQRAVDEGIFEQVGEETTTLLHEAGDQKVIKVVATFKYIG